MPNTKVNTRRYLVEGGQLYLVEGVYGGGGGHPLGNSLVAAVEENHP